MNKFTTALLVICTVLLAACTSQTTPSTTTPSINNQNPNYAPAEQKTDTSASVPAIVPTITVTDQNVETGSVLIDSASVPSQGWVVIHADDNGKPGDIIGYSPLNQGDNTNIKVAIDTTKATKTLYAMLHTDSGIAGTFEFPGDDAPIMSGAMIIMAPFTAIGIGSSGMNEPATITKAQSTMVEADDKGFYLEGNRVSSLTVVPDVPLKIVFNVLSSNVYHSGLDFKGCDQSATAMPGQSTSISFTPVKDCIITSYWPSSGIVKDHLEIKLG